MTDFLCSIVFQMRLVIGRANAGGANRFAIGGDEINAKYNGTPIGDVF